jgi:ferritin
MISKKIEQLLNRQIELEFESSQYYLSMASWAERNGFGGTSAFLYRHADEERTHALKLFHFINDRGGQALVPELKAPPKDFKGVQEVFDRILKHEQGVTKEINGLVDGCMKEKDYTTHNFLQWYVSEQIEEERLAQTILDKLALIGGEKGGLYLFDRDMATLAAAPAGDAGAGAAA